MKIKQYSLLVLLAGGAMIASFVLLTVMSGGSARPVEYPNEQGFKQAIIWFELVQSPEEVEQVLGDPSTGEGMRMRQIMDTVNTYDFLYMICYPLLCAALILFVYTLLTSTGHHLPYGRMLLIAGFVLSAIMFLGDVFENIQLFKLSASTDIAGIEPGVITTLQVATRIKNVPIFLSSLLLAYLYIVYFGKSWGIILPVIYACAALLGLIGITIGPARFLVETSYSLVALGWLVSIVHGGIYYVKSGKAAAV